MLYTKEKRVRDLTVKESVQRNEATSMLKTNWARKKDKVHKGEVKTRDDGENVVGLVTTKKMLLTKVIVEGTPRWVELDIRVEEDGCQQQTHKGVLLEVEPSSHARSKPKEFIKPSPCSGWMDKEDSTMFQSALGEGDEQRVQHGGSLFYTRGLDGPSLALGGAPSHLRLLCLSGSASARVAERLFFAQSQGLE
ncbi:unnamed protein product [Prunus brigantina]